MVVNANFCKKVASPVIYSHCGKPGHLKKSCFKIIGYPKKARESHTFVGSVDVSNANLISCAILPNSVGHNVHSVS